MITTKKFFLNMDEAKKFVANLFLDMKSEYSTQDVITKLGMPPTSISYTPTIPVLVAPGVLFYRMRIEITSMSVGDLLFERAITPEHLPNDCKISELRQIVCAFYTTENTRMMQIAKVIETEQQDGRILVMESVSESIREAYKTKYN